MRLHFLPPFNWYVQMTQQQVSPGEQASPALSDEAAEREANIHQAIDLIGQLTQKLEMRASQERREAFVQERRRVEGLLMKLGIPQGMFASLILSHNQSGPAGIRAFMERHFSSWDGEEGELQS